MLPVSRSKSSAPVLAVAVFFTLFAAIDCAAQSSDAAFPAPVFSNEITGRIAPRDIGDARRTRHFYTFRGTEGDVLVTLESAELIGDVDVFNANGLRPLLKITLLGDALRVTKSFYLRKEETLILRIEARAAGDAEGSYRVTFGGSFMTAPTDLANTPPPEAPTVSSASSRGKNVRRVTSTGARIEEPPAPTPTPTEVAKEPEPSPSPVSETVERKPAPAPRRGRGTRSSSRTRGSASKSKPTDTTKTETTDASKPETADASKTETSGTATAENKPDTGQPAESNAEAEKPAATPAKKPPAPRRRRGARSSERSARNESARTEEPAPSAQPSTGSQPAAESQPAQRLVVVTKDGETIERDMNTVRRVTVENNQLVVITKDGKVIRQPMANVLRMSIEP
jgi:hypothetical protein